MSDLDRLALAVLQPGFTGTTLPDHLLPLLDEGLGGVCLFDANTGGGTTALRALCEDLHRRQPAVVVAVDEEGGDVTRLHTGTGSPHLSAAALGYADDLGLTRATGAAIGRDLAERDLDLVLGPVADVNSTPDNPVIGARSPGADPQLVARHVSAWVAGAQSTGVTACLKHFPGHGDTRLDSHVDLPTVTVGAELLRARELVPFAAGVRAGARAVMTSHIVVTALDAERPATFSPVVLGLLRDELGFGGAIVTDALDMAGAARGRGIPEAAVLALAAGADVLCLGPATDPGLLLATRDAVVAAVRAGRLPEERLVEAAARVPGLRRRPAAGDPDRAVTASDARSTLRLDGTLPDLTGALVATVTTTLSAAIGEVPRGIPADVEVPAADSAGLDRLRDTGRPLVVQVRDLHRHPALADRLRHLAEAGPVVVVEHGWPGPFDLPAARVVTHGGSRPAYDAVAALLAEAGWSR